MPLREESSTCILYVSISVIGTGRQCRFILFEYTVKKNPCRVEKELLVRKQVENLVDGLEMSELMTIVRERILPLSTFL